MESLKSYFHIEKHKSLLFIAIGLIAIFISFYFSIYLRKSFYLGMSISLTSLALFQIIIGSIHFVKSHKNMKRIEKTLVTEIHKMMTDELSRLKLVMNYLQIYRYIQFILILFAISMLYFYANVHFYRGVSVGMLIQVSIMLILNYWTQKRGAKYINAIRSLSNQSFF